MMPLAGLENDAFTGDYHLPGREVLMRRVTHPGGMSGSPRRARHLARLVAYGARTTLCADQSPRRSILPK